MEELKADGLGDINAQAGVGENEGGGGGGEKKKKKKSQTKQEEEVNQEGRRWMGRGG